MLIPLVALILGLLLSLPAQAHSFGRVYNLPVPVWMYLWGAGAALIASFVVAALVVRPGEASRGIALPRLTRTLRALRVPPTLRLLALSALLLAIATGFWGTPRPYANFNMTAVWIIFLLGLAYLCALLGDIYAALNPWRTLADLIARVWPRFAAGLFAYPGRLASWPALLLMMAVITFELFGRVTPWRLSVALCAYTGITLLGTLLWGTAAWFRHGDAFAVFFRLLGQMGVLHAGRDGVLRLRAPFAGIAQAPVTHVSLLAFILFMLSSTAFDGLHETQPWVRLFWVEMFPLLKPWVGENPAVAFGTLRPLYMGWQHAWLWASPLVYLAAYWIFVAATRRLGRIDMTTTALALRFAGTLLPIALVYHASHYFTLLLDQGPRIVALLSDPFGWGWNLLGTAGWRSTSWMPAAETIWHIQVGLIVAGHVVSVYLAHRDALSLVGDTRRALISQLPMLLLMVLFTAAGLWILGQPLQN